MGDIHKELAAIPAKQRAREMLAWMRIGWVFSKNPSLAAGAVVPAPSLSASPAPATSTAITTGSLAASPAESGAAPVDLEELGIGDLGGFGGPTHPVL